MTGASEAATGNAAGRMVENWSVPARFQDFGRGVITLSGFFYFLGVAAAMLYLNMVLLGRRHWAGGESSGGRWLHSAVRVASVLLALFSVTVLIDQWGGWVWGGRVNASEAKLSTLSPESLDLIKQIPADRPVMIQAYYSPEVPREFVETKVNLLGLLREYAAKSGGKIQLDLVPTELYSEEARDAEKRFGIEPRKVLSNDQARQMAVDVILGVAFTSGLEEVVIPFFDRGPADRIRGHPLDPRGLAERPQEAGNPHDRRQGDGRVRYAELQPEPRVVDRHRAEEAVRRQLGRARRLDPG